MSKYLINITEAYRVDTEAEALQMIDEARKNGEYELIKYNSQYKERKQKGEVVDAWWKVSLTKQFNDEKEPVASVTIDYNSRIEGSAF